MREIKPYKNNLCSKYAVKMLSIKINSKCNRCCPFCVDKGGRGCEETNVEKIASEAIQLSEYKTVIITGGEPFLVFDKVVELATKLRSHKTRIVLNTNGTLLDEKSVKALNGIIDELQVSVHHFNEARNGDIMGGRVSFGNMKQALKNRQFALSINSTFNKAYLASEMENAVDDMVFLCQYLNADNLRLTELKKVDDWNFAPASDFFHEDNIFTNYSSLELIEKGCTDYYIKDGINVSVKRLCDYAKGENATAFSCCFIDKNGQKKIDVDTVDTFKVIYGDGAVFDDWIFEPSCCANRGDK